MAAVPSPAAPSRLPAPRQEHSPRERPDLRVVGPPRHHARFAVAVGLVTALVVFGIVALHALAAEASFEARELEAEIAELSLRHEELSVDIARLSAPDRVREVAAEELGMVPAEQPAYLVLDGSYRYDGPAGPRLADPVEQLLSGG